MSFKSSLGRVTGGVGALLLTAGALSATSTAAQAATTNFAYTGATSTYTVPAGVDFLRVKLVGGTGGDANVVSNGGGHGEGGISMPCSVSPPVRC